MREYSLIVLLSCLFLTVNAQQELSLHLKRDLYQSHLTNPAFKSDKRIVVSLPSYYVNYAHSAATLNDFIIRNDGQTTIDLSSLIANSEDENELNFDSELMTFGVGLNLLPKLGIHVHHAIKWNSQIVYPKTLAQLFWEGNAQFIGEEIAFGPRQEITAYNEIGLGVNYEVTPKITVGGRLKYLQGIGSLSNGPSDLRLFTSDDVYQLTLTTDYEIRSAGFDTDFNFDDLSDIDVGVDLDGNGLFEGGGNSGFAFDLGVQIEVTDKLDVAASVVNIGEIDWSNNTTFYRSQGTFQYDGLDFDGLVQDDSLDLDEVLDSLQTLLQFDETAGTYTTTLPRQIFLSASYQFNDRWRFGAMFLNESYAEREFTSVAVSADAKITDWVTVGTVLAMRNEELDNVGLSAIFSLGPVQVFALTDDIIGIVNPWNTNSFNGRVGMNVQF